MSVTSRAFVLGGILAIGCAGSLHPVARGLVKTPVEVWTGGGDALTVKFRDALEAAFEESALFSNSHGKKTGSLIVTIPSALGWNDVGKRTRVSYNVTYSDVVGQSLGKASGECWEDELTKCVSHVVKRAEASARNLAR